MGFGHKPLGHSGLLAMGSGHIRGMDFSPLSLDKELDEFFHM